MDHDLSLYPVLSFRRAHSVKVKSIIQLRDGTIVTSSYDQVIKRWSVEGHLLNSYVDEQSPDDGTKLSSSTPCSLVEVDDNTFFSGSHSLKLWNKTTGQLLQTLSTTVDYPVWCLLRLNNNNTFLCGMEAIFEERELKDKYEIISTIDVKSSSVVSLCELSSGSSDGHTVVVVGLWKKLKVWDLNTRAMMQVLKGHTNWVHTVIELRGSQDSQIKKESIIVSADYALRIWNVTTGKCLRVLKEGYSDITGLVELSDGSLLSVSQEGKIRTWNIETGQCIATCLASFCVSQVIKLKDDSIALGGTRGDLEVKKTWTSGDVPVLIQLCSKFIASICPDLIVIKQYLPEELCHIITDYQLAKYRQ
eukprot:TRINITY_DN3280_c0_g1_i3.p1 TRINITY_DN3280_c0_g1~~TRINITY_DN3280_c0_g1_i3.p1  ORF type:complete len:362 (-),score=64.61 TRINITY_DN3280_c0_g1_i3:325-1410(-)